MRIKLVYLALICVVFAATTSAQAVVIDDFDVPGLSEYNLVKVLDNGAAENNISFSDATGNLQSTYGGTLLQAEQVSFLRDDYSLAVGQILRVDTINLDVVAPHYELGIMVAATKNPTPLTRTNFVTMNMREQSFDRLASQWANATAYVNNVQIDKDYSLVSGLYIKRLSSLNFETGWYDLSGVENIIRTVTVVDSSVGNAIGFYCDMRQPTPGTMGALDNLRIVPEPSTIVMAIFGLCGLGLYLIRRK